MNTPDLAATDDRFRNRLAAPSPVRWVAVALASIVSGWGWSAPSLAAPPEAANVVYVESNDPAGNAILAYARSSDGSLTPLPGSPFPTGGLGITPTFNLGPFDSDQNLILNPSKNYLFAVNGGSDSISVFRVARDGSLAHVAGSPFPSGGSNPVSVGLAGDTLCVVNKDQNPGGSGTGLPNYVSFHVSRHGQLDRLDSTFFVDAGASPTQALVRPYGGRLFGADFMGGLIRSFAIGRGGSLFPTDAQPLPASLYSGTGKPAFPLGLTLHPHEPFLYVGLVTINKLAVYRYDFRGRLHYVSAVANSGKGICWLLTNRAGTRLYSTNTADPSVSVYDIATNPLSPVEIQKVALKTNGGGYQFALDSTESFLHVVTQQDAATKDVSSNTLSVLQVLPGGTLVEVASSPTLLPVPNLVRPQGVAAR